MESYTIKRVKKRDGQIVLFEEDKITDAITKASIAIGKEDANLIKNLSAKVIETLNIFFKSDNIPFVESIQDLIEKVLVENNQTELAKAYILYRKQHQDLRDTKSFLVDAQQVMDGYIDQRDWRVNENSNMNYSHSGLLLHVAGSVIANYTYYILYL